MKSRVMTLIVIIAMLAGSGAVTAQATPARPHRMHHMGAPGMHEHTVYNTMKHDSALALDQFTKWVDDAGLKKTLEGHGEFTVFAPNDGAIGKMSAMHSNAKNAKMMETAHVKYSVLSGKKLTIADLMKMDGQMLTMDNGMQLPVKVTGDKVMVGNATIVDPDHSGTNGVIQIVDAVIMPGAMMSNGSSMTTPMPMGTMPADTMNQMMIKMPSGK